MCIIIRDVHQYIGHCPIPLDPWSLPEILKIHVKQINGVTCSRLGYPQFVKISQSFLKAQVSYSLISIIIQYTMEASGVGEVVDPPPVLILEKILGGIFSRGYIFRDSGGTLPQNSYKPSQDLQEKLHCKGESYRFSD